MATGYTLDGDSIKRLRAVLNWWKAQPQNQGDFDSDTNQPSEVPSVTFYNGASEEVPPRGVMAITGAGELAEDHFVEIAKPSTAYAASYVVNGPLPVPAQSYGQCYTAGVCTVQYSTAGTPAAGELWGPYPGSWRLKKGSSASTGSTGEVLNTTYTRADWGVVVSGIKDSTGKELVGTTVPYGVAKRCRCQTTAALSSTQATATVDTVKATSKGWCPVQCSTSTLTAYIQLNPHSAGGYSADDNTVCNIEYHEDDNKWYIYDAPCKT